MRKARIFGTGAIFLIFVLILTLAAGYVFLDQLVLMAVNRFTECRISYATLSGNPLGKSEITGLKFDIKNKSIGFRAEKAHLEINTAESWRTKTLLLSCRMENVELAFTGKKKGDLASPENILYIPFSPGNIYGNISFSAAAGAKSLEVKDFKALSDDIRMGGYFTLIHGKDEVDMDIKISFAPSFANALPGDIRERVLSAEDDGWYGTDIAYKGSIIFLKALYSLAS